MDLHLHTQENVPVTEELTKEQEEALWSKHYEDLIKKELLFEQQS
jgi:hypothetical protein